MLWCRCDSNTYSPFRHLAPSRVLKSISPNPVLQSRDFRRSSLALSEYGGNSRHRTITTCSTNFSTQASSNTRLRSICILPSDLLHGQELMAWSCNKLSELFHCVRFDLLDYSFQLTKRKNRPVNLTESSETLLNSMSFKGDVPAHLTGNRIGFWPIHTRMYGENSNRIWLLHINPDVHRLN